MQEALFEKAISENYKAVTRMCYRYFGNMDDARDAVQDILIKVWTNRQKFRGDASIKTWIFRIATNVCLTTLQKNKHLIRLDDIKISEETIHPAEDEDHGKDSEEEKLNFFHSFMGSLTSPDRLLVNLYLENIDTQEIASITGLSEVNVRTRIHRIKKQIIKEWEVKDGLR